jgi:alginate O-acetyltransferase complex protein AlgJ
MQTTSSLANTVLAVGFVGTLAAVGVASHNAPTQSFQVTDAITGTYQAAYENTFKNGNPAKDIAIATLGAFKYSVLKQASSGAIVGKNGWLFTNEEIQSSDDFRANIMASAAKIITTNDQFVSQNITLVPVIIPDKADVYANQLPFTRPNEIKTRYSDFMAMLSSAGIDAIDGKAALIDAKAKTQVFMSDDTHWSPSGAGAVADAIAASIAGQNITQSVVSTTDLGSVDFNGDLLSYVPTGVLRPWIGPAQSQIQRYETTVASSAGLFGDAQIDIALVGTSFSAKPQWHFEGFLKHALQADILNLADEGQGPFAPMDAYLASDTLKSAPPKIVIWEIPVRYISKDMK